MRMPFFDYPQSETERSKQQIFRELGRIRPAFQYGFSLIELMVTVSIAAILIGIAAPSFQNMIKQNRVVALVNELSAAFNLARSEAVTRGYLVTVCKTSDPTATTPACDSSADWTDGWIVFAEEAAAGTIGMIDSGDTVLRVGQPEAAGLSITPSPAAFNNRVTYYQNGDSNTMGNFLIQDTDSTHQRRLKINATGRVRACNPVTDTTSCT